MTTDIFQHAKDNAAPDCPRCKGTGQFMYDHNHATICPDCCKHDLGWWKLEKFYGTDNGKWCCLAGCGHKVAARPTQPRP